MTRYACGTTVALLLLALAVPVQAQNYFLYTPKPVSTEKKEHAGEGVLVREITIQKGDTLSALSRKFSGRASYYPQILLFNDIRNPHLIHTGDSLKVPVTRDESTVKRTSAVPAAPKQTPSAKAAAQPVGELSLSDLKQTNVTRHKKRAQHTAAKKQRKHTDALPANNPSKKTVKESAAGRKLYKQAHAAYRQGDCKTALELFDRYLTDNSTASHAADASLYKADCYLKLSGQ